MNDMSLSRLYRRLVSARAHCDVDAAELVGALAPDADAGAIADARRDAVVASLAVSPPHADLARMLRVLLPASQVLAGQANPGHRAAHPARQRELRPALGARRPQVRHLRWAGGLAACLAVAFGLWSWHGEQSRRWSDVAAWTTSMQVHDRIFTSQDRIFASSVMTGSGARARGGDKLFQGNFSTGG